MQTKFSCRYDVDTGIFTVPPGGDGLYYFSLYFLGDDGEFNVLDIKVNGERWCSGDGNAFNSTHYPQAACSALAYLVQGKERRLQCKKYV